MLWWKHQKYHKTLKLGTLSVDVSSEKNVHTAWTIRIFTVYNSESSVQEDMHSRPDGLLNFPAICLHTQPSPSAL